MDFVVKKGNVVNLKSACLVAGVFEGKGKQGILAELDEALAGELHKAFRSGEFKGKSGQLLQLVPAIGLAAKRIIFVGLGPETKADGETVRRAVGSALKKAKESRASDLALVCDSFALRRTDLTERAQALAEGILLGDYQFDRYQTDAEAKSAVSPTVTTMLIPAAKDQESVTRGVDAARAICRGVILARDLVNEPGNV